MTPVKKYAQAKVVSGSIRAEVEVHQPQGNKGETTEPTVLVHVFANPQNTLTHEELIGFTSEVSQIVAEERDGEESQHG